MKKDDKLSATFFTRIVLAIPQHVLNFSNVYVLFPTMFSNVKLSLAKRVASSVRQTHQSLSE